MLQVNYLLVAVAVLLSVASPGPGTVAIAGASMSYGKNCGIAVASGILTGSLIWSATAAFGLSTVVHSNMLVAEVMSYAAAGYLVFLSFCFASSAIAGEVSKSLSTTIGGLRSAYIRGLLVHLVNPKPMLFFGTIYSITLPYGISSLGLITIVLFVGIISAFVYFGYAILFSGEVFRRRYLESKRIFETAVAIMFFFTAVGILVSRG